MRHMEEPLLTSNGLVMGGTLLEDERLGMAPPPNLIASRLATFSSAVALSIVGSVNAYRPDIINSSANASMAAKIAS